MKVNRQNLYENNKITSLWLHEFAYDLQKNAENIDFLKDYLDSIKKTKKFNTIEEKLADIKNRVGFDLAQKITYEIEKVSTASDCKCNIQVENKCGCPIKTASKHSPREVKIMDNILKYIKDMVTHEPYVSSATVLSRCKNEEGLFFGDIERKIDMAKLKNYIQSLLKSESDELASYTPADYDSNSSADDTAEYYNHAEPSLS